MYYFIFRYGLLMMRRKTGKLDGRVRVEKENSPHHYCSIQGYVSDPSTPIICLPNEVVVTIEGSEESTVDTAIQ